MHDEKLCLHGSPLLDYKSSRFSRSPSQDFKVKEIEMGLERKKSSRIVWILAMVWANAPSCYCDSLSSVKVNIYSDALGKAILFFEGQRSGQLPAGQRITWRGDSALSDGHLENVDLVGGYYDAGDNVKFVWPMSFTVSLLGMAAVEYGTQVSAAGQLGNLRTAIRWGTDFLLRAYPSSTTFYTQIGDGNSDHQCWERPEDMDTPRTLTKITASSPGTEPAADAAAALASAAIVFKSSDANYSTLLLAKSRALFDFADKYRSSYQRSCPFYCSYSGFQDELLWAATWLYKATKESKFLKYLTDNQGWSTAINEFSWDNKYAGAQVLLAKEYVAGTSGLDKYKTDADAFVCSLMPASNTRQILTTPGGLLFTRDSVNIQYAAGAAFLLSLHARSSTGGVRCGSTTISALEIRAFAKSQVDYILGKNPQGISYMVGYTSKYPTQLHHRGSSIPSLKVLPAKVGCNDGFSAWYTASSPNPNVHTGAVVGGPDSHDVFRDLRSDHSHLEPATYVNAAFVGAIASFADGTVTSTA